MTSGQSIVAYQLTELPGNSSPGGEVDRIPYGFVARQPDQVCATVAIEIGDPQLHQPPGMLVHVPRLVGVPDGAVARHTGQVGETVAIRSPTRNCANLPGTLVHVARLVEYQMVPSLARPTKSARPSPSRSPTRNCASLPGMSVHLPRLVVYQMVPSPASTDQIGATVTIEIADRQLRQSAWNVGPSAEIGRVPDGAVVRHTGQISAAVAIEVADSATVPVVPADWSNRRNSSYTRSSGRS